MIDGPALGTDARLEKYRLQALATAVFIGLSLAFVSSYISLQFPFGANVLLVLIAMGCLVYGVRYLVRNR
jgi:high-affinity Fe2+/Pb2+ permease